MSETVSFPDTETNTVGVEGSNVGDEDNGVRSGRRRCRDRSNRRCGIPLEIVNEAEFIDMINTNPTFSNLNNSRQRVPVPEDVVLEIGELETILHASENDRKRCRICHLTNDDDDGEVTEDFGEAMKLGCNCKGDLGNAHQKCAVTWFLTKGNLNCEICGAIAQNVCDMAKSIVERAQNVASQQIQAAHHEDTQLDVLEASYIAPVPESENDEYSLNGRMCVNILLVFMIIAFVISWLFHFKILH